MTQQSTVSRASRLVLANRLKAPDVSGRITEKPQVNHLNYLPSKNNVYRYKHETLYTLTSYTVHSLKKGQGYACI